MKNQVQFLKRSFNTICQKLKNKKLPTLVAKANEVASSTDKLLKSAQNYETNSSSGYTSDEFCAEQQKQQQESILVHTDETQIKNADITTAHARRRGSKRSEKATKLNLIKYLLDYEIIYVDSIENGLENYIRPLMAVINSKLYFQIFQNIEKIHSMSKFIQNKIMETLQLNGDFVEATIDVIYEYVCIAIHFLLTKFNHVFFFFIIDFLN